MVNKFLDKVEDNAIVRIWSEKVQLEKGDSLAKDYVLELWDYTRISVTQNSLQELKEIWDKWNDETKQFILEETDEYYWHERAVDHGQDQAERGVALGHVDEAISDLFDRLGKGVTPVPAILVETFRSLNACRRAGEDRFIGCAQLLLAWFHSHFWKVDKISYRVSLSITPR
ncbi:hypothetical protein Gotur_017810 [Gossypium turneri]